MFSLLRSVCVCVCENMCVCVLFHFIIFTSVQSICWAQHRYTHTSKKLAVTTEVCVCMYVHVRVSVARQRIGELTRASVCDDCAAATSHQTHTHTHTHRKCRHCVLSCISNGIICMLMKKRFRYPGNLNIKFSFITCSSVSHYGMPYSVSPQKHWSYYANLDWLLNVFVRGW